MKVKKKNKNILFRPWHYDTNMNEMNYKLLPWAASCYPHSCPRALCDLVMAEWDCSLHSLHTYRHPIRVSDSARRFVFRASANRATWLGPEATDAWDSCRPCSAFVASLAADCWWGRWPTTKSPSTDSTDTWMPHSEFDRWCPRPRWKEMCRSNWHKLLLPPTTYPTTDCSLYCVKLQVPNMLFKWNGDKSTRTRTYEYGSMNIYWKIMKWKRTNLACPQLSDEMIFHQWFWQNQNRIAVKIIDMDYYFIITISCRRVSCPFIMMYEPLFEEILHRSWVVRFHYMWENVN